MPEKYSKEVIAAARVVIDAIGVIPGLSTLSIIIPQDLVDAVVADKKPGPRPEDLMGLWNERRDTRLPACAKLTAVRRRHCAARLREFPDRGDWERFIKCINGNDWLLGVAPSKMCPNWKANFDWFIRPASILKFVEGGFEQWAPERPVSARDAYGDELDRRK